VHPSKSPRRPKSLRPNESVWTAFPLLVYPYLGTGLLAFAAERADSWALRLLILPLIGGFQNHLQVLSHEGAHLQIHPNRRWNDLLTNAFCSVPFFGFLSHYRKFHLDHHRFLCDPERDPEVSFYAEQGYHFRPMGRVGRAKMLALDFVGYHFCQFFFAYNRYLFSETRARRLDPPTKDEIGAAFWLFLGTGYFLIGFPHGPFLFFYYWLLPQATFMFLFLKLQGYGEHTARTSHAETCTLSHDANPIVRFFIFPFNSDRHREHHVYPTVPWYRLRGFRVYSTIRLGPD
jgi:fatty acid desaturase